MLRYLTFKKTEHTLLKRRWSSELNNSRFEDKTRIIL